MPQFYAEVQQVVDRVLEESIMAEPLPVPASVEEFESPLWNAHVLRNKLANTQRQLMDASRRSGMADVATAVLHNVGNVLNSVNVSASVVMLAPMM